MNAQLINDYLQRDIAADMQVTNTPENRLIKVPLYLRNAYNFYEASLFNHLFVLAEPVAENQANTEQTKRHLDNLRQIFNKDIALLMEEVPLYKRKKLIQARMDFIVPGKQLFLPQLFIDLKENRDNAAVNKTAQQLLPSAQRLVIFHLLDESDEPRPRSFKELAPRLGYTAMGVTKIAENLSHLGVIDILGTKEKTIRFRLDKKALWEDLEKRRLLKSPVLKKIFVDKRPEGLLVEAGETALAHYSNMNAGKQLTYAFDKKIYYELQKKNTFVNPNAFEGVYCLEVWKYDPVMLPGFEANHAVDPLSLYLSLQGTRDERLEMGLEQIVNKYIYGTGS